MTLALAKSHRFVIRNVDGFYVANRGHDQFGTLRRYTGQLKDARLYSREGDATRVANELSRDYGGEHIVVPMTLVMMEEQAVA